MYNVTAREPDNQQDNIAARKAEHSPSPDCTPDILGSMPGARLRLSPYPTCRAYCPGDVPVGGAQVAPNPACTAYGRKRGAPGSGAQVPQRLQALQAHARRAQHHQRTRQPAVPVARRSLLRAYWRAATGPTLTSCTCTNLRQHLEVQEAQLTGLRPQLAVTPKLELPARRSCCTMLGAQGMLASCHQIWTCLLPGCLLCGASCPELP